MTIATDIRNAAGYNTRPKNQADDVLNELAEAFERGGHAAAQQRWKEYGELPLLISVVAAGRFRDALKKLGIPLE
jgi:hypothetical protein